MQHRDESFSPEVVQAVAGEDYTVYAYFTDGTIHLFDMKPLINRGGVFDKIKDETFFKDNLTVMNHTIAWDFSGCFDPTNCIDIDPYEVYQSERVDDPLEKTPGINSNNKNRLGDYPERFFCFYQSSALMASTFSATGTLI